jgi:dihydrofolate reductase
LKKQPGKAIWVGGSNLALSFIRAGLIDEFRFTINPVVIGAGTPIFKGLDRQLKLELIKTRKFRSGNVMHYYRPKK